MAPLNDLSPAILDVIEGGPICEFATMSAAGVPIDTPVYYFPADDLSTIGVATGLAYPAKAERARRNPKVGLLFEAPSNGPVVLIHGHAAVRDADLQNNAVRYISETGFDGLSFGLPWSEARKAVWYWTRMIVEISPERISWWDSPASMDTSPSVWHSPSAQAYPQSDPSPKGKVSPAAAWPQRDWREIAADGLARGIAPHLTLIDKNGFPIPARARSSELVGDRFRLTMPAGIPWLGEGKATLTFLGIETFVGEATRDGDSTWFSVERALPQLPLILDPAKVLQPDETIKLELMARLEHETQRRGQPIPTLPEHLPELTRLARLRRARAGGAQPMAPVSQ